VIERALDAGEKLRPTSVTNMPSRRRSNSGTDKSSSSFAIAWVTAGCERCARSAAMLTLWQCATSRKTLRCRKLGRVKLSCCRGYLSIQSAYSKFL
jgi:hypothetical protein